jgi:DNA-binding CsgD family transcriptional regulator
MALAKGRRRNLGYRRFLIRPLGLAESQWAPAVAILCGLALVTVAVLEMMTPNDVVASLGLLPLLAALWALPGRLAALVSLLAIVLFALMVLEETRNRPTLVYVGAASLVIGIALRLYATSLADLLAARVNHRPAQHWAPPSSTLEGVDGSSHGIRALTRRELEVAQLASQGYMASEIGTRLHISDRTVETHLAHAYSKLGVNSRPALIRISAKLAGQ